jgi:hypothetical protein
LCLSATIALPAQAESIEETAAKSPPPFAGNPISARDLRSTTATGLDGGVSVWGRSGDDLAVILSDEAVPPRNQTPAPRPGKHTEIRQGGSLLMTTISVPQ